MENLGQKIKEMRESLGWSKSELARISGVSRTQILRIESGESAEPHDSTMQMLTRAMNAASERRNVGEVPNVSPRWAATGEWFESLAPEQQYHFAMECLLSMNDKYRDAVMENVKNLIVLRDELDKRKITRDSQI